MTVKPAHYGWSYGYYNDRECFPVSGPGISRDVGYILKFASPKLAEEMCSVLQSVYMAGAKAAKDEIREAIGSNAG